MWIETTNVCRYIAGRAQESWKEMEDRPRSVGWSTEKESMLQRLEQDALFFEAPIITKWKRRLSPNLDKSRSESVLIRRNAIYSGMRAHHLATTFHTTGVAYANA